MLDARRVEELQRSEVHAGEAGHGGHSRMVSDWSAVGIEEEGGEAAEDNEAGL